MGWFLAVGVTLITVVLSVWAWKEQTRERGDSVSEFKARVFKDDSGQFRFRLVATNGEPVAQSEGYSRKIDARTIAVALVGEDNVEEVEE